MSWRFRVSVGLSLGAVLLTASSLAAQPIEPKRTGCEQQYRAWPPSRAKTGELKYNISGPGINPELGPRNEKIPPYKPHPLDKSWIAMYNGANELYRQASRLLMSLPKSGPLSPEQKKKLGLAAELLREARLQYGVFINRVLQLEKDWNKRPHYQGIHRWRMWQMAAAAYINQGNARLLVPDRYGIIQWGQALDFYGALDQRRRQWRRLNPDTPVLFPGKNKDDLRLVAQAHNNLAVAKYLEYEKLARDKLRQLHGSRTNKDGWLKLSRDGLYKLLKKYREEYYKKHGKYILAGRPQKFTSDIEKWWWLSSDVRNFKDDLQQLERCLANFRAALKYQPENELYFMNLYNALRRMSERYYRIFDRKRFAACKKLLSEMREAAKNCERRKALVSKLAGANDCLGPALAPEPGGEMMHSPTHSGYGPRGTRPKTKPAAKCPGGGLKGAGPDCVRRKLDQGR